MCYSLFLTRLIFDVLFLIRLIFVVFFLIPLIFDVFFLILLALQALTVLEYLVINGSERVIDELRQRLYQLQAINNP